MSRKFLNLLLKIKRYKICLIEQKQCLPETLPIHYIFLWVFFIKTHTHIYICTLLFLFSPCTLLIALGALILFSAEQKEMSEIILINVSYLILSVNKCFVCLITCTCKADFSSSCDLKELSRDCTVKIDYTYC